MKCSLRGLSQPIVSKTEATDGIQLEGPEVLYSVHLGFSNLSLFSAKVAVLKESSQTSFIFKTSFSDPSMASAVDLRPPAWPLQSMQVHGSSHFLRSQQMRSGSIYLCNFFSVSR